MFTYIRLIPQPFDTLFHFLMFALGCLSVMVTAIYFTEKNEPMFTKKETIESIKKCKIGITIILILFGWYIFDAMRANMPIH